MRRPCCATVRDTRVVLFVASQTTDRGWLAEAALRRLISAVPRRCLLVIRRAYHEFARHAGAPILLPLLAAIDARWVVLRTFSKAYCLAGLRIGTRSPATINSRSGWGACGRCSRSRHPGIVAAQAALDDAGTWRRCSTSPRRSGAACPAR